MTLKVRNQDFSIATCQTYVNLPNKNFYGKVLFFTQLSCHLMRKLLKKSWMVSNACLIWKCRKIQMQHFLGLDTDSIYLLLVCIKLSQGRILDYQRCIFDRELCTARSVNDVILKDLHCGKPRIWHVQIITYYWTPRIYKGRIDGDSYYTMKL